MTVMEVGPVQVGMDARRVLVPVEMPGIRVAGLVLVFVVFVVAMAVLMLDGFVLMTMRMGFYYNEGDGRNHEQSRAALPP